MVTLQATGGEQQATGDDQQATGGEQQVLRSGQGIFSAGLWACVPRRRELCAVEQSQMVMRVRS